MLFASAIGNDRRGKWFRDACLGVLTAAVVLVFLEMDRDFHVLVMTFTGAVLALPNLGRQSQKEAKARGERLC